MTGEEKEAWAREYADNINNGKGTDWGDLTPKQQRAVKEYAVENGYVNEGALHGNSLATPAEARGYTLRDRDSGEIVKYGETTLPGTTRYTKPFLKNKNVDMVFETKGTKEEMHTWQNKQILDYVASTGVRPPLNWNNF